MYDINFEFYDEIEKGNKVILIPVRRLKVKEKVRFGKFTIYPQKSINREKLMHSTVLDSYNSQYVDKIMEETTICFTTDTLNLEIFFRKDLSEKNLAREYIYEAEQFLNILKFASCKYSSSLNLSDKAGLLDDGKTVILAFNQTVKIIIEEIHTHSIIVGNGLRFDEIQNMDSFSRFLQSEKMNEVGHVLKYALELNTLILEANSLTSKFILSMKLIEYLAEPTEFLNMKKTKAKIIPHIAENIHDIHKLSERFMELTGKKDENGKHIGYRTRVVHFGDRLEDLLSDQEIISLLAEIQGYIYKVIIGMLPFFEKTWAELEDFRSKRYKEIESKKDKKIYDLYADSIILIDMDFLHTSIIETEKIYKELYHGENFEQVSLIQLILNIIATTGLDFQEKILPVQILYSNNQRVFKEEKLLDELHSNSFKFGNNDIDIYTEKCNKGELRNGLIDLLKGYLKEGNGFFNGTGHFSKIIVIADDEDYYSPLQKFQQDSNKKIILGRLDNWNTKMPRDIIYFDIYYNIALAMGIPKDKL